jgi:hypothetical protein
VEVFQAAMQNDLDTPRAVAVMAALAGEIIAAAGQGQSVAGAQGALRGMARIFGIRIDNEVEARVREGWGEHMGKFNNQ